MTIVFDDDLVLEEDKTFEESIKVNGHIRCEGGSHDLTVQGNIDAGSIDALDIDAGNIDAVNIDAGNIDAWSIDAFDIYASDIDAFDIYASDIDAGNIDAGNIDAFDIDASEISFYAFCIARFSIKCTGIEGRKDNSIYEALDGEVKIREKPKTCDCCGQELPEGEK